MFYWSIAGSGHSCIIKFLSWTLRARLGINVSLLDRFLACMKPASITQRQLRAGVFLLLDLSCGVAFAFSGSSFCSCSMTWCNTLSLTITGAALWPLKSHWLANQLSLRALIRVSGLASRGKWRGPGQTLCWILLPDRVLPCGKSVFIVRKLCNNVIADFAQS